MMCLNLISYLKTNLDVKLLNLDFLKFTMQYIFLN